MLHSIFQEEKVNNGCGLKSEEKKAEEQKILMDKFFWKYYLVTLGIIWPNMELAHYMELECEPHSFEIHHYTTISSDSNDDGG